MGIISRIFGSADLVSGMARRLGADLGGALGESPDITALRLRSMVIRCAACRDQPGCEALQRAHDRLDRAPDYCMNRTILERHARA